MATTILAIGFGVVLGWLGVLTYRFVQLSRRIRVLLMALKHVAGAEKHVGGKGRRRRGTDFRVPVRLSGFLRVLDHARPCRIVDLSRSGAQVRPDGGHFPLGEIGVLTIEFGEFDNASSHVRIARAIETSETYGVEFIDPPPSFRDRANAIIQETFREQLGQT
jgi:hypothetical protein